MRIVAIFICSIVFSSASYSQNNPPPFMWQHCYGGSLDDIGYSIAPYSDGGFLFCGCAGSSDGNIFPKLDDELHGGTCDYWAARIDADSNILYKVHLGGTASDVARCTFETADGSVIIAGSTGSNDVDVSGNHGDLDFWVVKVNSVYQVQWKKCYGGNTYDDFGAMISTTDGGFAMCGGVQSNNGDVSGNHGSSDYWLVKTDAAGAIQWQKCYGGSDYEKAFDLKQCSDGGYIMTGFTSSQDGDVVGNHSLDFDGWVVKTDASGTTQWKKCLGGTGQDALYKVKELMDGNFLLAGYEYSNDGDITNNHGDEDAWLTMLDHNGNLLWSKAYGGDSVEEFSSLQQDVLGGIIVSGYSKSFNDDLNKNNGKWDYWLMSVDENGTILWDTTFGGSYDEVCTDVAISTSGRVGMMGYTSSDSLDVNGNHGAIANHHGWLQKKDYWLVNLGSVVGIHEIIKTNLSVIPTLAHDVVQVSSDDLENEVSFVTVRNENGQVVLTQTINHELNLLLDVSSLPAGIYFVEARNEKMKAVSKFVKQ